MVFSLKRDGLIIGGGWRVVGGKGRREVCGGRESFARTGKGSSQPAVARTSARPGWLKWSSTSDSALVVSENTLLLLFGEAFTQWLTSYYLKYYRFFMIATLMDLHEYESVDLRMLYFPSRSPVLRPLVQPGHFGC